VANAEDSLRLSGTGFGFEDDVFVKAIGEYLERFVSFRAPHADAFSTVEAMGWPTEVISAILSLLTQISDEPAPPEHVFRSVRVSRIDGSGDGLYPAILLSLHNSSDDPDSCYAPVRDSSGTAIHRTRHAALQAALLEFVERQCSTAMWMSGRCNNVQTLTSGASLVELGASPSSPATRIVDLMTEVGEVTLLDISFIEGAKAVFIEFKPKSHSTHLGFAFGAAAAFDLGAAAEKAVVEAWQTSLLRWQIRFFRSRSIGGQELIDHFAAVGPAFNLGVKVDPIKVGANAERGVTERAEFKQLVRSLCSVGPHVVAHEVTLETADGQWYYAKIASPHFFLHMNPGHGNNNDNPWIRRFGDPSRMRLEPMPFT
jgi:hypothetical protein